VLDSLRKTLKIQAEDTGRVMTAARFSTNLLRIGKYDSARIMAQSVQELALRLKFNKGIAEIHNNLGVIYRHLGNYTEALNNFQQSLDINTKTGDKKRMAANLSNMGLVNWNLGNYHIALDFYTRALNINTALAFKDGIAANLSNMGIIYNLQGNPAKALEYNFKALALNQELHNKFDIANLFGNIGNVYSDEHNYSKALEYDQKALAMDSANGDKTSIARLLGNIGNIYINWGKYPEALENDLKALELDKEIGDKNGMALTLENIGLIYNDSKDYIQAATYYKKSATLYNQIGDREGLAAVLIHMVTPLVKARDYKQAKTILDSSFALAREVGQKEDIGSAYVAKALLDSVQGDYKTGWEDYKNYLEYRDSVINEAATKKTVEAEMNFDFEQKQTAEKAAQDKKDALATEEKARQLILRNSFMGGFGLMIALAFFIFRGYRQKQKANIIITLQKEEVEHQKALVEERNKDILDSIAYAKRLQDAILPPLDLIRRFLPRSFVLYKPKDIVAGDFYWMEKAGDILLIAAADCTGHGVPGALVSVVCSNALNRTVKEFHITEPGKILDKVRELVLETFEKSERSVQDGMDISLCAIDLRTHEVQWTGANNPLWYTQNDTLFEVGPSKQPVGRSDKPLPFQTHTLKLKSGDNLFLFTDGYADQFGGPKGKKFKYKPLQEKLLSITTLKPEAQREELEKTMNDWKGNLEQVDDILIIGITL
jgi:tetratricopeptide (TPR) repeat protein